MDRGTNTTPVDVLVLDEMSRYYLANHALRSVPRLQPDAPLATARSRSAAHR